MTSIHNWPKIVIIIVTGDHAFFTPVVRIFWPILRILTGILTGNSGSFPEVAANPHESSRAILTGAPMNRHGLHTLYVCSREDSVVSVTICNDRGDGE
jgi:hypothetical protein